jgi:hypothetical protein
MRRRVRNPVALSAFAWVVIAAFVVVSVVPLTATGSAVAEVRAAGPAGEEQTFASLSEYATDAGRDKFKVTELEVASGAPAAGKPDPGSAKAVARSMLEDRGWGDDEYDCLVDLWQKESQWNVYAYNAASDAYGIPQALPGKKMASAGSDWETSAKTQIKWGLGYISGRYKTPCGAWETSEDQGWY